MIRAIALWMLLPASAFAHAQLEQAVPPVGSTISNTPAELQLFFSEGLEPHFTTIVVNDAGGARVDHGFHLDPADAKHALVPVPTLMPGIYTVIWHAVSVDTHKTQGTYHFTVRTP